MKKNIKLILASNSARRQQLLRERGLDFHVTAPPIIEPEPRSIQTPPAHWAEACSYFKARSVAKHVQEGYILAADTIIDLKGKIIGKANNAYEAREILHQLSGSTHRVITGVTLLTVPSLERMIRHDVTEVTMREMSEEAIDAYVAGNLWEGKAGAYGIQDQSDVNIESISGSYTNVMGLPMELVENMLIDAGIYADVSTPARVKVKK